MTDFQEEWVLFKIITRSNQYFKKGDILEVSNFGNVLCNREPYECKINKKLGYKILAGEYLHRIVAEKFLSDWDPTKQVDHKDTNRLNNRVDNLCMVTHKENCNNPLTLQHQSESQKLCYVENRRSKIPWNKGGTSWNKGKHHSEETKRKISETKRKKRA